MKDWMNPERNIATSDWKEDQRKQRNLLRVAIEESGGDITDPVGFVREPVTGLLMRVPTEQEIKALRGAEGLMCIIPPGWGS